MSKVIALLILFSAQAFAGPQCTPYGQGSTGFKVTLAPTSNPAQWMTNSGAYYVTSWWCAGKYKPSGWFYVGSRSDLPSNWLTEVQKVPLASLDVLLAAQSTYMTKTLSPEMQVVGRAQLNATKPVFPVWLVAKNSTYTTRQVFPVVNGVRGTTAVKNVRATVGAPCACNVFVIEEGKNAFCPVYHDPTDVNQVTLCTKQ